MRTFGVCRYLQAAVLLLTGLCCHATDVPDWLRAQVAVPVPDHDEQTNAVAMYGETVLTVQPNGKMIRLERRVYRILRPDGASLGIVGVEYDPLTRLQSLHAWSIPASGNPYATKDKEIVDVALQAVDNSELLSDVRVKAVQIPAAVPGSLIGYEYLQDTQPYQLADMWNVQGSIPALEQRYTLVLPAGWTYLATWLNHEAVDPVSAGPNAWQWIIRNSKPIRIETGMPPWQGIAGRLWVTFRPPGSTSSGLNSWHDIGIWYQNLVKDRRVASPAIKQKVAELTANEPTLAGKIYALAAFVQRDVRYVAIELGIGGYQPHPAADVFAHRYGDCKDKSTLLSTMLKEIGVDSYYVIINTERGSVDASTPPNLGFNHVMLAIQMPAELDKSQYQARTADSKLGDILYFDPTDEYVPLGNLSGSLQANYGLVLGPDGGELLRLPQLATERSAINRSGTFVLDEKGTLSGEVHETRIGDAAAAQRYELRNVSGDADKIRPIEALAASAFTTSKVKSAAAHNLPTTTEPLDWDYSVQADNYARAAGDLLLVRPRVIGSKVLNFWEPKQVRENVIEFDGPERDTDVFQITVPAGYAVDELPAPLNLDLGSVAYHSKVEFNGQMLRYTRTYEIKELSVPVDKLDQVHRFYNAIVADERSTAVLKRTSP
jgi:hypothetical protein